MSMGDKSYCATFCDQEDCERNVRFNKPTEKYYSMTTFDDVHENHKHCPWKIKKGLQNEQ